MSKPCGLKLHTHFMSLSFYLERYLLGSTAHIDDTDVRREWTCSRCSHVQSHVDQYRCKENVYLYRWEKISGK